MKHFLLSDVDIQHISYENPAETLNETDYVVVGVKKGSRIKGQIVGVIRNQASYHLLNKPAAVTITFEGGLPLTSKNVDQLRSELGDYIGYSEGTPL